MNLVGLLLELKPLMADPEANFERITELLELHQGLAEYEVARFYVSRQWLEPVERMLRSVDPRERLRGTKQIPLLFARATAAGQLRRRVKDADQRVARSARAAVHKLGLADVSLPDRRFKAPRVPAPLARGGWNATGWSFGLPLNRWGSAKKQPPLKGKLPKLATPKDIAELVGVKEKELEALMRPGTETGSGYVEFEVPKRSGGVRRISRETGWTSGCSPASGGTLDR
jgi:hypothetical protein